ncbi:MAG: thiazole synthase [Gammaproteobacteria bacterium]
MWSLKENQFNSHLILGTAQYPSLETLVKSIKISQTNLITVSLQRERMKVGQSSPFCKMLSNLDIKFLPNTAGAYSAKAAISIAQVARDIFNTSLIKLEVIQEDKFLSPNGPELITAAERLIEMGFDVLPFCTGDLSIAARLVEVGCHVLMPWGSPIGSGQGIQNETSLKRLRERFPDTILILDAGLGRPSDAARVMEWGFDAVLVNSAIAKSHDPVNMAQSFAQAIEAGRKGYLAGIMPGFNLAQPSSTYVDKDFWSTLL